MCYSLILHRSLCSETNSSRGFQKPYLNGLGGGYESLVLTKVLGSCEQDVSDVGIILCILFVTVGALRCIFWRLDFGLRTYNFWICITSEQLWNISNSVLMVPALETWELISLENSLIIATRNKLTKVYSAYMVNK